MANDREYNPQPGTGSSEDDGGERIEQFNELSELSLEERMAVADRIGIPVNNVGEAAATGTASGDDAPEDSNNRREEQSTSEGPDR